MLDVGAPEGMLAGAAAANQTAWMERTAVAAGGVVRRERGVTWMVSPAGAVFAFPTLTRARLDAILPTFLESADEAPEASCWSLLPTEPPDLDSVLRDVGFREGWQAQWMAAALDDVPDVPVPAGTRIAVVEDDWTPTELPWDGAGIAAVRTRLAAHRPRRVWHVAAWDGDGRVGHATLNVTAGALGVAGVYDMGVAPGARRQGIGGALTRAVCALGRQAGCAIATLNATPEGELLYRTLGFRSVGVAQTWWR